MKRFFYLFVLSLLALSCATKQAPERDWVDCSVVYELNTRQFTPEGTFAAAQQQLPRLKALGVDIIWLMPIYPIGELERKGSLGSYYAIRDYNDVNPEFGTMEDFDAFLAAAHEQGFKVILDWVANHTSPDHPWVTENDPSWYYRDSLGHTIVEYDWTDIAKLNYDNIEVGASMRNAMRFWVKRGVDGFRCDVAYQVPDTFWSRALGAIRAENNREFYFLAEGEETWLHKVGFDATYAWKLHHLVNDIAQGKADGDSLARYIAWNAETYPANAKRLSFTSNHDENSWSGTEFERMGDAWKAMTVLCWTLPESQPLIYTGQEIGYDHRFKFFEKDPVPEWKDNEYTEFYKYLTKLRHDHPALDPASSFKLLKVSPESISYRRKAGRDKVTVTVDLVAPWSYTIDCK
ncbi:MAG: alpha-amylase [Bacteroidales bacterium]|nr:alpha-amylase [Bacteroidales bacterium]